MNILINASNLKKGGGMQVADSFIRQLYNYKSHKFYVVVTDSLSDLLDDLTSSDNLILIKYTQKKKLLNVLFGKDAFLNNCVREYNIDRVFSIFAPFWRPSVKHICGFAKPQYIYKESPFFYNLKLKQRVKYKIVEFLHMRVIKLESDILITENLNVSTRLFEICHKRIPVFTVTNYYNQIFEKPSLWDTRIQLPKFSGFTLLTICANYPHKNLKIIPDVVKYLNEKYPNFLFRFILTISPNEFFINNVYAKEVLLLGNVGISECPSLYFQSDALFLPTLLECFSASYPEAMFMKKPILTSDIGFAKGICGDAAMYFNPLCPASIGEAIYRLANNVIERDKLIANGIKRLKVFDTYEERTKKYLKIIETGSI